MHFHNIHNIISKGISDRRLIFFSFIFSGRQSKRQCLQWRNQSMKWSSSVIRALRSRTVHIMKHLLYLWVRVRNAQSLHIHSSNVSPHLSLKRGLCRPDKLVPTIYLQLKLCSIWIVLLLWLFRFSCLAIINKEIKSQVYDKRQTSYSSWEILRIENKQVKTVQNNSYGQIWRETTYFCVEVINSKWQLRGKLGHAYKLTFAVWRKCES